MNADEFGRQGGQQHSEQYYRNHTFGRRRVLRSTDEPDHQRAYEDEQASDESRRQGSHRQRSCTVGLSDSADKRQQAPRRHIVRGSARQRHCTEFRFGQPTICQDAGQYREGRDRQCNTHEQGEARE